jgi:hypothetical protein
MKLSPELEHEYLTELIAKQREIAREEERRKTENKRFKDRIEKLEIRRDELLDLLEGRQHAQVGLPLTTPRTKADDGKKPAPPLKWDIAGMDLVALTAIGTYRIEMKKRGPGFFVSFETADGKSKRLDDVTATSEKAAKEVAERDWLVRGADSILENAGHGALSLHKKGKAAGTEVDVSPRKALPPKRDAGSRP